jgi:SpoIVB peptidase S55
VRRTLLSTAVVIFALAGATAFRAAIASAADAPGSDRFAPVESLKPGQKAIVRTVFQGSAIEEFEAEILGVLKSGRVAGDIVLARATSERVLRTGIAQGMSGSPVYVDGRLIGALSSGWSFTREPVFGITPIGEMLPLLDRKPMPAASSVGPSGAEGAARSTPVGYLGFQWAGSESDEIPVAATPAREALADHRLAPLTVPLAGIGLNPVALDYANTLLARYQLAAAPGGRAQTGRATPLEPGSALAVDLLRGDLELAAFGTVTWVSGDRVLAFGHPFFQAGDVRLPMATAEIATVIASDATSFKIGLRGEPVGTIEQDRRSGISGVLGPGPAMLPIAIHVRGITERAQHYRFESIEDRSLAPLLVAIASINSVLESGGAAGTHTYERKLTLHRKGVAPLVMEERVAGDAAPAAMANGILEPLRFLYGNPFERLELDSVRVDIEALPGRREWGVRNARLLQSTTQQGSVARVRCDVESWRGVREVHDLELEVPKEMPDGRYILWIGGADELARFEAQRLPGRYRPISLDDAWRRLGSMRRRDALYAVLFAAASEVTSGGRDYPELPASALPLLAGATSRGDAGIRGELASVDEVRVPFDGPVRGQIQLPFDVASKP